MMLETGTLHADPHPGNLIVEEATGRLAILDWGLVTELDPGLRVAYIEHIAHLVAKDYASRAARIRRRLDARRGTAISLRLARFRAPATRDAR